MPSTTHHRVNSPAVIAESIDGEVVIIDLGTGTYYSARGPAGRIWDGLAAGLETEAIVADVSASFDTTGVDVDAAVGAFLAQLVDQGLLVAGETEPSPAPAPAPVVEPAAWSDPELETF